MPIPLKPRDLAFRVRDNTMEHMKATIEELLPKCDRKFTEAEKDRLRYWVMDYIQSTLWREVQDAGYTGGK